MDAGETPSPDIDVLVRVLQRNRTHRLCVFVYLSHKETESKELAPETVEAGRQVPGSVG